MNIHIYGYMMNIHIIKKWLHDEYAYILYSYEYSDNQIIDFYNYYFANYKHNLLQNKYDHNINLNSYGYWNI